MIIKLNHLLSTELAQQILPTIQYRTLTDNFSFFITKTRQRDSKPELSELSSGYQLFFGAKRRNFSPRTVSLPIFYVHGLGRTVLCMLWVHCVTCTGVGLGFPNKSHIGIFEFNFAPKTWDFSRCLVCLVLAVNACILLHVHNSTHSHKQKFQNISAY